MRPSSTKLPAFLVLTWIGLACSAGPSSAEIVWVNDWDSPGEKQALKDVVRVTASTDEGFQVFRDLDGNGRYGTINLVQAHRGWGPHQVTAPAGRAYSNIVLRWSPVEHHKPCAAGFSISVSHTGAFKDEAVTVSTPNSTGHSDLVLKLAKHPQFDRATRIFVRLNGRQNCGWALSGGGLVMTADVVEAKTGRRILPPPPAWVHPEPRDAGPFLVDATGACVVSPRIGVSINGYERIEPEVFSLTAYEGAPDFDTRSKYNGLDFCREYGIEGIGYGTVYPLMGRLRRQGLVDERSEPSLSGPPRKVFSVSAAGHAALAEWAAQWDATTSSVRTLLATAGALPDPEVLPRVHC